MALSPANTKHDDRRNFLRFPFNSPIRYGKEPENLAPATECNNLSRKGLAFMAEEDYHPGATIHLLIEIEEKGMRRWLPLSASVRWTRCDHPGKYHIGVEFAPTDDATVQRLIQSAIESFNQQINNSPENIWIIRFRGDALRALGDEVGANADYARAESLKKKSL